MCVIGYFCTLYHRLSGLPPMQAWESLGWYFMCERRIIVCCSHWSLSFSACSHTHTHLKRMCVCWLIPDMWLFHTHVHTSVYDKHYSAQKCWSADCSLSRRLSNGWPVLLLKSHRMISELIFIYLELGIWTDLRDFLHNWFSPICAPDMNYTSNCIEEFSGQKRLYLIKW